MRGSVLALAAAALAGCQRSTPPRAGPVSVTVAWGSPVSGAPVAFHRPDGSVQEVAVTDASGKATAVVPEGGLVTIGWPARVLPDRRELTTIAGLAPGDDLLLAQPRVEPSTGEGTVTFPGPVDGASRYYVDAACTTTYAEAGYVSPLRLWLEPSCGDALDAVALAFAPDRTPDSAGTLLAYATAADVPISGTPPAQTAAVALGAWRSDFGALALEATNAPAGATLVGANLWLRRNGRLFVESGTGDGRAVAGGGSTSLALQYPQGFATSGHLVVAVIFGGNGPGPNDVTWAADPDAELASRAVDLAATLPPRLSAAALAETHGALVASWDQVANDPALDGVILTASWTSGTDPHAWNAVAPPGATAFRYPSLPPELADWAPAAGAPPADLQITAFDGRSAEGYGAFKATCLGLLWSPPPRELALRGTSTRTHAP